MIQSPNLHTPSHTTSPDYLKEQVLDWAQSFPYFAVLDNCGSETDRYGKYELLAGVSTGENKGLYTRLCDLPTVPANWLMGVFPYELRHTLNPDLTSRLEPPVAFPEVAWFEPEVLLFIRRGETQLYRWHPDGPQPFSLPQVSKSASATENLQPPDFQSGFTREAYLETIKSLQAHIREGDFYEINLSQAFTATYPLEQPGELFRRLTAVSPVPFAGLFRWKDRYLICASPERFLQLEGDQLRSQPIKGTAARGQSQAEDQLQMDLLRNSEKEQAENVMIVDLTRNDLYRSCLTNSVQVENLFEVQTFPQVHQLVSTVSGIRKPDLSWSEIFAHTFPPGSMTGAPKIMTMGMIDKYEKAGRGVYAGSLGYMDPNGHFDLNVVIRSLLYDAATQQLSYHVGGAITYDSDPEREYEETLIKASAIRAIFSVQAKKQKGM